MKNLDELASAYTRELEAAKLHQAQADALKAELIEALNDAHTDCINTGAHVIERNETVRMSFSSKAFRADFSDVFEEYKRPQTVKHFTVKAA